MNLPNCLLWGFAATIVLTTLTIVAQSLGLTRIDIPFIIGTMFTANRDRAKVIGVVVHILNGWLFAFVYALFFQGLRNASTAMGAAFGVVQGIFVVSVLLPLLPGIHPRMASEARGPEAARLLEPPGFLAANYGRSTPLVMIVVHAVYGAVLGFFYVLR